MFLIFFFIIFFGSLSIKFVSDIAHAKMQAILDSGKPLPDYIKNHVVYYAGPAKTPEGEDEIYATGSFGPTTAGRMDSYVAPFQGMQKFFLFLFLICFPFFDLV